MKLKEALLPSFLFLLIPQFFLVACEKDINEALTCTDILGCVSVGPQQDIQLGVLQALSGGASALGKAQIRGLELAMDKRGGKIHGHPIRLQVEDTGCTAEGGANAALKIIADPQTIAIYGTTCSGAAATASKASSAAGLTMVSGNNSAPFLTSIGGQAAPDWYPGYFRAATNEENAGRAAAEFVVKKLGLMKAATIHDNDIYTKGLVTSFSKGFEELGGSVSLSAAINKGDTEMEPILTAVINSKADVLFFPLFQPEGNKLLRQARKMDKLDNMVFMSDGALIQESFVKEMGDLARGMYFVGPTKAKGEKAEQVTARYIEKYGKAPEVSYFLRGYDAADILFYAIEKAAVRLSDDGLSIGRMALRRELESLKEFQGVTGMLSCDEFGDCGTPTFNILRMDDPTLGLKGLEKNIYYSNSSP